LVARNVNLALVKQSLGPLATSLNVRCLGEQNLMIFLRGAETFGWPAAPS
jgi:hypothetical protein